MFHVDNFTVNLACLCRQLRTDLHPITNFRFHIIGFLLFILCKDSIYFE